MVDDIEVTGEILDETEHGLHMRDSFGKQYWLPKSQIKSQYAADGNGVIVQMPYWLARERGAI